MIVIAIHLLRCSRPANTSTLTGQQFHGRRCCVPGDAPDVHHGPLQPRGARVRVRAAQEELHEVVRLCHLFFCPPLSQGFLDKLLLHSGIKTFWLDEAEPERHVGDIVERYQCKRSAPDLLH